MGVFCVLFLDVFFCYHFLWFCFFVLMDAFGSYLKKGVVWFWFVRWMVSPESSESHQPFQAPIAKSEKKIREEKRELLGFCRNGAENLLDVFFFGRFFFLGQLKTKICVTKFSSWQDICLRFLASFVFVELPLFLNVEEGYPGARFSRCPEGL